jgi:hypothetical protein
VTADDERQAEWDHHVTTALDVARTDEEAAGIAIVAAAGRRAWDLHKAGDGETGEAA